MTTHPVPFVAIASIAADLSVIMEVAEEISLAAANAKAIAFRAGEKAKGFQPITDFINELAKNTITLVDEINQQALLLYQLTIQENLLNNTCKQFEQAIILDQSAPFQQSLLAPVKKNSKATTSLPPKHCRSYFRPATSTHRNYASCAWCSCYCRQLTH